MVACSLFLRYIRISLFPVIFSYAEKNFSDALEALHYSGVPNKRGGVRIIGGLEMVQYNSKRGLE